MELSETAYAKINLALHVRKRREDGYHELETLFAFVDAGDELTARTGQGDQLTVDGEFSGQLDDNQENLVEMALAVLPHGDGLSLTLEKRLPVAAGLGGGSADAGAVFRLVERISGLPDDWMARAASLGADVPACVRSRMCLGSGTGTILRDIDNDLSQIAVILVNPRFPLSTGEVFRAWDGVDRGRLPDGEASRIVLEGRNDLEEPARRLCPQIGDVLAALRDTGPLIARMSGSGATCFALYRRHDVMTKALENLRKRHPSWWLMPGRLR